MAERRSTPTRTRTRSALGRLETFDEEKKNDGKTRKIPSARPLGYRRRPASGLPHAGHPTSERWATHLREYNNQENGRRGYEYYAEGSRNVPHPSEEFLRWRLSDKSGGTRAVQRMRDLTRESFYMDYSHNFSNDGDANNEVLVKIQGLKFDPSCYKDAARRELEYNPPIPRQYIVHHYVMDDGGHRPSSAYAVERPASASMTRTCDCAAYASDDEAQCTCDHDATNPPAQEEDIEEDARGVVVHEAGPEERENRPKSGQRTDRPPTPYYPSEAWERSTSRMIERTSIPPPPSPPRRKPGTTRLPQASKKPESTKKTHFIGVTRKKAETPQCPDHWVVRTDKRKESGLVKSSLVTTAKEVGHHHGSDCIPCARCKKRELDALYERMETIVPIGRQGLLASMPHNPPPEVYRYRNIPPRDPKENAESAFEATKSAYRSHYTIARDWPSEAVTTSVKRSAKLRATKPPYNTL